MTNIYQLLPDIRSLVKRRDGWFTPELASHLGDDIATRLQTNFGERKELKSLRLSKMGPMCPRHLWYSVHRPELAEELPAEAIFKFGFGHTIEAMAIALAKAAGHEVTGEQDELVVAGIKGHRDCVLDGYIVDVKSCSGPMFKKIAEKRIAYDDDFGYLDQLDGYMVGSAEDDLVRVKDVAFIWGIDKTLGKMTLYEHRLRKDHFLKRLASHKEVAALDAPPQCTCEEVKDGESGNLKLGVKASYSAFKWECNSRLRCFLYADGPRYLTRVVRRPAPHIIEVNRYGQRICN